MKPKYYSINEVIRILEMNGSPVNMENIGSCIRERLINPILYIDSYPAYACEKQPDGSGLAVGFCFLSAYWKPGDNIIAFYNTLIRDGSFEIKAFLDTNELLNNYNMDSWQTDKHVFAQAPANFVSPKKSPEPDKIKYFHLLENKFTLKNLMIPSDEISLLVEYINTLNSAIIRKSSLSRNSDITKKEKTLLNVIGALVILYLEIKKNTNQSSLITEITDKFKNPGLSKRNLEKILPAASQSLENT